MENNMKSSLAVNPEQSKGRLHAEVNKLPFLSAFAFDRQQVIESTAFRRLEYKTQVFIYNEGDHYRNRLTHSLEAAQVSRIIATGLEINSDLSETITLAHDLGHAPFGHAGERALDDEMKKYGLRFNHNSHTIKLITSLEQRHPQFDGLNLTWETIEGIAKHNGPIDILDPQDPIYIYNDQHNLDLKRYSSLEAQVAAISDDIAYNNHDIDDGFRAGLLLLKDLEELNQIGEIIKALKLKYSKIENNKILHEALQILKIKMIKDVVEQTKCNILEYNIKTIEDVRSFTRPVVEFSKEMESYHQEIKQFLANRVYKASSVKLNTNKGEEIIKDLFQLYCEDPSKLPKNWSKQFKNSEADNIHVLVCDFIACMSDKYAIKTHNYFSSMS